ncbi:Calmodulin-lysine N-methyltransferase [Lamellibrachia satsuma]|nr:Calmodulin-lysine N-methyltransferase [Lamellibrachia satsuma]
MTPANKTGKINKLSEDVISVPKKRWKILADVIKQSIEIDTLTVSVRRFHSFGLLKTEHVCTDEDKQHIWYLYTCPAFPKFSAQIRLYKKPFSMTELRGFNNTGNVCVWPAEEVLAYFCLQRSSQFKGRHVCELGGGMTSLAGLAVATYSEACQVTLTDGNEQSVKNVEVIIQENKDVFASKEVMSRVLRWDDEACFKELADKFDYVICADCLFFDDYRLHLVNVLHAIMKPKGEAIIFAPKRGKTFEAFEEAARSRFRVCRTEQYDEDVWKYHQQNLSKASTEYDADLHYPILLQLFKGELPAEGLGQ